MHDIRAFTMGDERYFLGMVALLNSMRISGNTMPLTVLDVGLAAWQRDLLDPHCELLRARPGANVFLMKMDAPLASGADIVLLLDSDIIVTGPLAPMVDPAAAGRVCAYGDQMAEQRWFAEWEDLFGLRAPLREGEMYVNAGALAVSTTQMPDLLPRWAEMCERVSDRPMLWEAPGPTDPLWLADQDPLNALLMSEVPPDSVVRYGLPGMILGTRNLAETRVLDAGELRCSWRDGPVTLLHAVGRLKPWQPRAQREYRRTAYTTCLRRALAGPDLVVRVPTAHLPSWLRPGATSAATGWALHGYDVVARRSRPLRRRLGLSSGQPPVARDTGPAVTAEPPAAEGQGP